MAKSNQFGGQLKQKKKKKLSMSCPRADQLYLFISCIKTVCDKMKFREPYKFEKNDEEELLHLAAVAVEAEEEATKAVEIATWTEKTTWMEKMNQEEND